MTVKDREFLEQMSRMDDLAEHPDALTPSGCCGHCATQIAMASAARQLLEQDGTIFQWSDLFRSIWQNSKYYKLYQEELAAGRNPQEAFAAKGWEL